MHAEGPIPTSMEQASVHPMPVVDPGAMSSGAGGGLEALRLFRRELLADLFHNEGLAQVFAHARNVLTCAMLMAAGMFAVRHHQRIQLPGMWTVHLAGYLVAAVGVILLLMNLYDGLRRLSRRRHSVALRAIAICVYIGLSLRLTQVLLYFRTQP
jgi:hypothetical protein